MEKAIETVKNNEMGWLLASKVFKVPQSTLRRHAREQNKFLAPIVKMIFLHCIPMLKLKMKTVLVFILMTSFLGLSQKRFG